MIAKDSAAEVATWSGWFSPRIRFAIWLMFTIAWTAALLTPQPVEIRNTILAEESREPAGKALHVGAYAVLAILTCSILPLIRSRIFLLLFLSTHAMLTEYFQGFVPQRTASWVDVGWDHLGIGIGLLAAIIWRRRR